MNIIIFYIVILLTNIIQGITGFAGTILAMPPGILLVGFDVAKPILNVLGILAGLYVFATYRKAVNIRELKKIVAVMFIGMLGGIFIKSALAGNERILYRILGIFIMALAVSGYYRLLGTLKGEKTLTPIKSYVLLLSAGIAHAMFVSGGPLLIGYLSKTIKDKKSFRATISTVWIILNTMILIEDIGKGLWSLALVKTQVISLPFLIGGMVIGTWLYKRMSQLLFMKITYILLFIAGVSLLFK